MKYFRFFKGGAMRFARVTVILLAVSLALVRAEEGAAVRYHSDHPTAHAQQVVSLIDGGDAAAFVKELDADLQAYIDGEILAERLALVGRRLGKSTGASWGDFLVEHPEQFPRVSGMIVFEKGEARCDFVYSRNYDLLGVRIETDAFTVDTFDALKGTQELADHAAKYWRLLFSGKPEEAYEVFIPKEAVNVFPKDQFLQMVGPFSAQAGQKGVAAVHLHTVRIKEPSESGEPLSFVVYQLVEQSDGRLNTTRMGYEWSDEKKTFQSTQFDTANFADVYPSFDYSKEEAFFRALASGKGKEVSDLFHPADRGVINPAVSEVFVAAAAKKLGAFKSIDRDRFSAVTTYDEEGYRTTRAEGWVHFENETIEVGTLHGVGTLESFDLNTGMAGWTKDLQDFTVLDRQAQALLTGLMAGDLAKVHETLPPSLQTEIDAAAIQNIKEACQEHIGTLKSITFASKEPVPDDDLWKLVYKITTDRIETVGHVTFEFNALMGKVLAFNIDFNPGEEEPGAKDA